MKKQTIALALGIGFVSTGLHAAPINPTLNDKFALSVGPFLANIDTKLTINGEQQDFEDYLDDNKTTAAIQGLWRITEQFRFNFGYWAVNRDTSDSSDQNHTIAGVAIPAGTSIGATFDSSLATASLGWSFVTNDTTEFGADLGLASIGLKSELGASVPGAGSVSFTAFDKSYLVPTIGLYVDHALSPMWSISGRLNGIGLDLGNDFKGSIVNAAAAVEARPWKNIGLGLAYLYSNADAKLNDVLVGSVDVDWKYQGPFAFVTFGFGEVR